ncbi:MAG: C39 family peptidase [Euryarchaeota archaeon]|nr:C39 family peptidase [Euryarchaeota archaeon]
MQSTNHTCGPAALATVLNNLGINTTEQELATLAGTDENGTTMYGLVEAAKAKGFNGVGMKLLVDDLKPNNIVFVTIDGGPHYSVVREVTNESVKLADPSLGNIEMSREDFTAAYSGNALVITDPNNSTEVNGTTEQTKNETDTNSTNVQADNSKILIDEEMQNIKGKHALIPVWVKGWFWSWYEWKYGRHTHIFPAGTVKGSSTAWLFYRHEGWYQKWGWYRKIYGWHVVRIWCWTLPWNYVGFFTPPWPYYG